MTKRERKHTIKSAFFALFTLFCATISAQNTDIIPLSIEELISEGDSLYIAQISDSLARENPMFLPFVAQNPNVGLVQFNGEDNALSKIRMCAYNNIYQNEKELIEYHKLDMPDISQVTVKKIHKKNTQLLDVKKNSTEKISVVNLEQSLWKKGMQVQLHASQNYISSNWYNGGESNLAGNLYLMGFYNYNKKSIQWDNKIEYRLGINTAASDSLRKIRVNEDILKINTKLGIKAVKSFFYTAELDFQTHFFNTFEANTKIRTTGPLSPIRMNLSLGVDYKYKSDLSVFASPLSYKLTYVADTLARFGINVTDNIPHKLSLPDGQRMINQLGALLRVTYKHTFVESINLETNFSFFGAYVGPNTGVEIDLEVIGNFRINRFLSAKISLHPRYDTIVKPTDGTKPRIQFKELISLGFNYQL